MNILFLAHRIPYPPDKGDKIRSFHEIRQLARNHRVHLACLADDPRDLRHIESLREYCESVVAVYRSRVAARSRSPPSSRVWGSRSTVMRSTPPEVGWAVPNVAAKGRGPVST